MAASSWLQLKPSLDPWHPQDNGRG
jgi:hypothetical protein